MSKTDRESAETASLSADLQESVRRHKLSHLLSRVEVLPTPLRWSIIVALVGAIGILDEKSGTRISLSLLYVAPVLLAAWTQGSAGGWVAAVLCGAATFAADVEIRFGRAEFLVPAWNAAMRTLVLAIFASVAGSLHLAYRRERRAARIDSLTEIPNARCFYEEATREIARARRSGRPVSLAYVDLDDFKLVNDRLGHEAGDELLRTIAGVLARHVRPSDLVARLGGDEFAILLTDADEATTRAVLGRLAVDLREEVRNGAWPASASVGAVVFATPRATVGEMVARADALMYTVKRSGKAAVVVEADVPAPPPVPSGDGGVAVRPEA